MINQQREDFLGFQEGLEGYFKEFLGILFNAKQPRFELVLETSEEFTVLISFLFQEPVSYLNVATLTFTIKNTRKQHLNSFLFALSNLSPPVRTQSQSDCPKEDLK